MLIWTLLVSLALASTVNAKVHRLAPGQRDNTLESFNYRPFTLPTICGQNEFPDQTPDLNNTFSSWWSNLPKKDAFNSRMAEAHAYTRKELPSLVQLLLLTPSFTSMCSGVIIHPQIVMTHSVCVNSFEESDIYVLPSAQFSRHPFKDWNQKFQPKFRVEYYCQDMGVAMLVLETPLQMHVYQRAACVDTRYIPPLDSIGLAAGFGMISFNPPIFATSPRGLKLYRYWQCKILADDPHIGCYRAYRDNTNNWMTPNPPPLGAVCEGDAGGPYIRVNETGHHYVTGIIQANEEGPGDCREGESLMDAAYVVHFAYVYNEVVKNWLAADPDAYKITCFKNVYKGFNPPPVEVPRESRRRRLKSFKRKLES